MKGLTNSLGIPIAGTLIGQKFNLTSVQRVSYNHLIDTMAAAVIKQYDAIPLGENTIHFELDRIDDPEITPSVARRLRRSYETSLYLKCVITKPSGEEIELAPTKIVNLPVMLRSKKCITTKNEIESAREGKYDGGGYFIINGKETTLIGTENFALNQVIYERKELEMKEITENSYTITNNLTKPMGRERFEYIAKINTSNEKEFRETKECYIKLDEHGEVFVYFNGLKSRDEGISLITVLYALGIRDDETIVYEICGKNGNIKQTASDLRKSLSNCKVSSQRDAYDELIINIKEGKTEWSKIMKETINKDVTKVLKKNGFKRKNYKSSKEDLIVEHLLKKYLIPHCETFDEKRLFLSRISAELFKFNKGLKLKTDKDNMIGRRVNVSGYMIGTLLRDSYFRLYKSMKKEIMKKEKELLMKLNKNILKTKDIVRDVPKNTTYDWFERSFSHNFLIAGKPMEGIRQDLERTSQLGTIAHLRRIANYISDTAKSIPGPHRLHTNTYGVYCPSNTPAGGDIGLRKHLAIGTIITTPLTATEYRDIENYIKRYLTSNKTDKIHVYVVCNGHYLIGDSYTTSTPAKLVEAIKDKRKNSFGTNWAHVSVSWNKKENIINILSDAGRVLRPLLAIPQDKDIKYIRSFIKSSSKATNIEDLIRNGIVEYLDASEIDNVLIAESLEHFEKNYKHVNYTHCEVHPTFLFGVLASTIPFAQCNPGVRVQMSARQGKSAVGITTTRFYERTDSGIVKTLNNPQIPIISTYPARIMKANALPDGFNPIIALMVNTGYNMEDSLILNATSVERGMFNSTNTRTYYAMENEDLRINNSVPLKTHEARHLNSYGIVKKDAHVKENDILVRMVDFNGINQNVTVRRYESGKVSYEPIVGKYINKDDKYKDEKDKEELLYTAVRVTKTKLPKIGDKFAVRSGQKGMVGLTIPHSNMPFSAEGIVPDLIMNPHGIPSRMTCGIFYECSGAKLSLLGALGIDATFNDSTKPEIIIEGLKYSGYEEYGDEILYDPRTGRQMNVKIFMGSVFYRRLVQQVSDKMFYRLDDGRVDAITKQPIRGRSAGGGLRLGNMEKDSLLGHGISLFQRESFTKKSDGVIRYKPRKIDTGEIVQKGNEIYQVHICDKSHMRSICNPNKNILKNYLSNDVGFDNSVPAGRKLYNGDPILSLDGNVIDIVSSSNNTSVSVLNIPKASQVFLDEIQTAGVKIQFKTNTENHNKIDQQLFSKIVTGKKSSSSLSKLAVETFKYIHDLTGDTSSMWYGNNSSVAGSIVKYFGSTCKIAQNMNTALAETNIVVFTSENEMRFVNSLTLSKAKYGIILLSREDLIKQIFDIALKIRSRASLLHYEMDSKQAFVIFNLKYIEPQNFSNIIVQVTNTPETTTAIPDAPAQLITDYDDNCDNLTNLQRNKRIKEHILNMGDGGDVKKITKIHINDISSKIKNKEFVSIARSNLSPPLSPYVHMIEYNSKPSHHHMLNHQCIQSKNIVRYFANRYNIHLESAIRIKKLFKKYPDIYKNYIKMILN
jgi:DNA-directed RNA polymerase beta subunit